MTSFDWLDEHPLFGWNSPRPEQELVYHYTSTASAAAIALTGHLSLTPLRFMNDPTEAESSELFPMTGSTGGPPRRVSDGELVPVTESMNERRANVRIVCFSTDIDPQKGVGSGLQASRRGYANQAMWAHYGDAQTGAVVILDKARLLEVARERFGDALRSGQIRYREGFDLDFQWAQTVDFDSVNEDEHFHQAVVPTLFSKSEYWRSEAEFRVAVVGHQGPECMIPIEDCVEGVVYGMNLQAYQSTVAKRSAERLGGIANAALLHLENRVLTPVPMLGVDGTWKVWSKRERRDGAMLR